MELARRCRRSRFFARLRRWGLRFETRWTPLGRALLLALLFAGLFALNMRASLAFQLAALLLVGVVLARLGGWLVRVPGRDAIRIRRRLPGVVTEQVPFHYTVEVANRGTRSWRQLELEDGAPLATPTLAEARAQPDRHDAGRPRFDQRVGYPRWLGYARRREGIRPARGDVPALPPRGTAEVQLQATPTRRGTIALGNTRLQVTEPLGLVRRWRNVAAPASVIALPSRYPVAWRPAWSSAPSASSGASRRQRSEGGDVASLREYRPGDPLAHLSWRGLARYGVPVVKEFDEPVKARWQVVLDCASASTGDIELATHLDERVRIAASFAEHLVTAGMPVELLQIATLQPAPAIYAKVPAELVALHTALALAEHTDRLRRPEFNVPLDDSDAVWVLHAFDASRRAAAAAKLKAGGNLIVLVVRPADRGRIASGRLDAGPLGARPGCFIEVPEGEVEAVLAGHTAAALAAPVAQVA